MMTSMTLQKSRFPVQHIFSTNPEFSKSLISQNKTSQRLALAGGVGSGEDRTPIELFIAGVRGWDINLRRQIDNGKSKQD